MELGLWTPCEVFRLIDDLADTFPITFAMLQNVLQKPVGRTSRGILSIAPLVRNYSFLKHPGNRGRTHTEPFGKSIARYPAFFQPTLCARGGPEKATAKLHHLRLAQSRHFPARHLAADITALAASGVPPHASRADSEANHSSNCLLISEVLSQIVFR